MANVPVYNITDVPTKRAIMALEAEVSELSKRLKAMTTRNGVEVNQFGLDKVPTQGSDNAVASGGTFTAIADATATVKSTVQTIFGNADVYQMGRLVVVCLFGSINDVVLTMDKVIGTGFPTPATRVTCASMCVVDGAWASPFIDITNSSNTGMMTSRRVRDKNGANSGSVTVQGSMYVTATYIRA